MRQWHSQEHSERGYALMFVLFLMALVIIAASTLVLDSWTQGQREKDAMMIWRGEQYTRAIGLFYRKFGRFPTSIDDLVKEQTGNMRFLREAYKNPMNKEDGSWRFIYVTPAGQLLGSVRYSSLQQMAFLDKQREMGLAGGATGKSDDDSDSNDGSQAASGQNVTGSAGSYVANGGVAQAPPLPRRTPQTSSGSSFFSQSLQQPPSANGGVSVQESSDGNGQVIGGFIIGVAGKEDKSSVKVYKGGLTYKQWEFIFNPLEQVQTIATISTGPQNPAPSPTTQAPLIPQPPQPQIPQPQ